MLGIDLNPIGGISKLDLRGFIDWAKENFDLPILSEFLTAVPTAELVPYSEVSMTLTSHAMRDTC